MMAYVAGFGGGKDKGISQIEQAVAYGGDNQTEARFALILLYNREKRYDDALKVLAALRERYPRNRLVWLESGSTLLRAGRAGEAERFLSEGLTRLADDKRPRMFGEEALWRYKRGIRAGRAAGRADAPADLGKSRCLSTDGNGFTRAAILRELAKLAPGNRGTRPGQTPNFARRFRWPTATTTRHV